jgi:Flavin containing amine oxidoreductase
MKRRDFIQYSIALVVFQQLANSCRQQQQIAGRIVGANAAVGHQLRDKKFPAPSRTINKEIVIIGGGVSGLSAARHLYKNGKTDFVLLDLENKSGGNAAYGKNGISAFPFGAHYIPVPNNNLNEYHEFLHECDVITGFDEKGIPSYNEYHLCFDPEERLYLNGRWQEGLIPHYGLPENDLREIEKFLGLMNTYRYQKGKDGKDAFAIPVNQSSTDEELTLLDSYSMKEWLIKNDLKSEYLHWYVNYCTRDDFGTPYETCSAWAGIHYFASRKGKGTNAEHGDVLTWPEGNGFLTDQLAKNYGKNIITGALATAVRSTEKGVQVEYFDTAANEVVLISAKHCIMAVPQFIAARLLNDMARKELVSRTYHYAPWMVANLVVANLEERSGVAPAWDNVIYNSKSLGYVDATHQDIRQQHPKKNLTYYLPLTEGTVKETRSKAQKKTHEQWAEEIIKDLEIVHPDIRKNIEEINIMIWAHAMVQPLPGIIFGDVRKKLATAVGNIHFAHTDIAGISIFEEGFYQGLNAAKDILGKTKTNGHV